MAVHPYLDTLEWATLFSRANRPLHHFERIWRSSPLILGAREDWGERPGVCLVFMYGRPTLGPGPGPITRPFHSLAVPGPGRLPVPWFNHFEGCLGALGFNSGPNSRALGLPYFERREDTLMYLEAMGSTVGQPWEKQYTTRMVIADFFEDRGLYEEAGSQRALATLTEARRKERKL